MSNERLLDTLRSPYVSEKATRLVAYNQYVFLVAPGATRTDVRRAVEQMFDVKVEQVNVVNIRGKSTSFRSRSGRRQARNKAYVRLADGQSIDVLTKA